MISMLEHAVNNKVLLDTNVLEAYSTFYEKEKRWLTANDEMSTIQELINKACDTLEEEGHDLTQTDTSVVFETINTMVNIKFHIPPMYIALREAYEHTKETYELYKVSNVASQEFEQRMLQTMQELEIKLKNYS